MSKREMRDGRADGLTPLQSLDLTSITSFAELARAMAATAFGGRRLGQALDVCLAMVRDPHCKVVMTLSGAMTVAKQGRIICQMIDRGLVHAIVATGALMAHGLTESIGLTHYAIDPDADDKDLFDKGYNRVYDTLELESNLDEVCEVVAHVLATCPAPEGMWSSARFCRAVGAELERRDEGPGILRSAYRNNVPVFIPAFTDSELGLDFSTWAMQQALAARHRDPKRITPQELFVSVPPYNPFLDLQEYALFIAEADTLGIFTVGGGVPRNWAQQVGPYFDITSDRLGVELPAPRFKYGVRLCPEPVYWGGLSGCTYSEGVSWGKFIAPEQGGQYAEVLADATIVWPLLMKAVFEELDTAP